MRESARLHADGIITGDQLEAIQSGESQKNLSVHWELTAILSTGILLFTSGLGILIYKNIDTIGHQAILALIAAGCAGCLYYAFKRRLPFSTERVDHPSPYFDYVVLLGCLLFGIFTGYIQYQYRVFGLHYGIAALVPTILFFTCAYIFDHKGALTLGISGLAGWAGFSVTPGEMLAQNDFSSGSVIVTAIILGSAVASAAHVFDVKNIKRHFCYTYNNFAANMLFIASLASLIGKSLKPLSFLFLGALCFYFIRYAIKRKSLLFLLLSAVYGYVGLTYSFLNLLIKLGDGSAAFHLGVLYVMASCAGIIIFFALYKSILGIKK